MRCRQTNHEGEYVEFLHAALDNADAIVVNPGAWTHYSWAIRDALEPFSGPVVEVHLSDVDAREEWRRASVLEGLTTGSVTGQGVDGYRRALELLAEREGRMNRIERLAARLDEPLLVTGLVNVRYLTGLESSNAARPRRPRRATRRSTRTSATRRRRARSTASPSSRRRGSS